MDSLIAAAARALVVGDALGALKRVGLRDDPPALALRGIAMAQLGEHPRARELLRRAARGLPPSLRAVAELAAAEVALRSLRTAPARAALARAHEAAERARVPALLAEVAEARAALDRPAARRFHAGHDQPLRLDEVEALIASGTLVVDGCRRGLRAGTIWLPLARRPGPFALARALAGAWPGGVDRHA